MPQEQLIVYILNGLMYGLVLYLIVIILKMALTERETTEEAQRIIFSEHGAEQEAEEIIYEYFKEV